MKCVCLCEYQVECTVSGRDKSYTLHAGWAKFCSENSEPTKFLELRKQGRSHWGGWWTDVWWGVCVLQVVGTDSRVDSQIGNVLVCGLYIFFFDLWFGFFLLARKRKRKFNERKLHEWVENIWQYGHISNDFFLHIFCENSNFQIITMRYSKERKRDSCASTWRTAWWCWCLEWKWAAWFWLNLRFALLHSRCVRVQRVCGCSPEWTPVQQK